MANTINAIQNLTLNRESLNTILSLTPRISHLGQRCFTLHPKNKEHRVPLKVIVAKVELITEEMQNPTNEQIEAAEQLILHTRVLNLEGKNLLKKRPIFTRILHWIRSFFGNLSIENHEKRLKRIHSELPNRQEHPAVIASSTEEESASIEESSLPDEPSSLDALGAPEQLFIPDFPREQITPIQSEESNEESTEEECSYIPIHFDGLYIPPSCFVSDKINQIIGAMVSLLQPGYNTLKEAKDFNRIPSVELNGIGLTFRFDDEEYSNDLARALTTAGFQSVENYSPLVAIANVEEIAYFLKIICKLDINHLGNWLMDSEIFDTDEGAIILSYLSQDLTDLLQIDTIPDNQILQVDLPFKAGERKSYNTLLKEIGARISLMRPGGNVIERAKQMKNIPEVSWNSEEERLVIQFTEQHYLMDLTNAIAHSGIRDIWFDELEEPLDEWEEENCIYQISIGDPYEVISFLDLYCQCTRGQILFLLSEVPGYLRSFPFGRTALEQLARPEKIDAKIKQYYFAKEEREDESVFHKEDIDETLIGLTQSKMRTRAIPDVPLQANDLDREAMLEILDELNFYDPEQPDYLDPTSILQDVRDLDEIKRYLTKLWNVAEGNIAHIYGMPRNLDDLKKYRTSLLKLLKHITYMLRSTSQFNQAMNLVNLGIGAGACGGRFIQEVILAYHNLLPHTQDPLYRNQSETANFNMQETRLFHYFQEYLREKRTEIFERILGEIDAEDAGDLSHTRNYYTRHLGRKFGIPGSEAANYHDPFEQYANPHMSTADFENKFFEDYNVTDITNDLSNLVGYVTPRNRSEVREVFMDVFRLHAPDDIRDLDEGELYGELYPDYEQPDRKYLIQMLQYLGFFSR